MRLQLYCQNYIVYSFLIVITDIISPSLAWTGQIVFQDDFNGNSLDRNKWFVDTGCAPIYGGKDLQCYKDSTDNIAVRNGKLRITARPDYSNGKYSSGRIRQKTPLFTYGAYVARMKMPKGKHLWPAFWLLLQNNECMYEEIDILEYRGQETTKADFAAHLGRNWANVVSKGVEKNINIDLSANFHEYALLWIPSKLQWYIDGRLMYEQRTSWYHWTNRASSNKHPCRYIDPLFQNPLPIIFNMAVGGSFFPPERYPALTRQEAEKWPYPTLEVDWVRIYQE